MSVVNKMLNDLEQREQSTTGQHQNYQPPTPSSSSLGRWLVYSVLFAVVVAVLVLEVFYPKQTSTPANPPVPINSLPIERNAANDGANSIAPEQAVSEVRQTSTEVASTQNALEPLGEPIANPVDEPVSESVIVSSSESASTTVQVRDQVAPDPEVAPEAAANTASDDNSRFAVTRTGSTAQSSHQMLVADALAHNDVEQAKQALQAWISDSLDNLEARKKLAALYFAGGQNQQAEQLLDETQSRFPQDASVRLMRARLYVQMNQADKAWAALQINSREPDLLHYRASLARQQLRYEQAARDYTQLTQFAPTDVKAWLGLAVTSEALGNAATAVSSFQQVVQLATDNRDIRDYARSRIQALQEVR